MSGDALLLTASADAFDFLSPTPVAAGTAITVHDAAELAAALHAATGGETIFLAAGDYGRVVIDDRYGDTVTLLSDPAAPAVIRNLVIRDAAHVTLDGAVLDYSFTPGKSTIQDRPFTVTGSDAITLRNIRFDGDVAAGTGTVDDGAGAGIGLTLKDSRAITVENSLIAGFYRGATVFNCDGITFTGNEVTAIRSDGLNLAATQGALISGNYFHDFREAEGSTDHRDMIQVYSAKTTRPSTDLTITGNIFDMGQGSTAQTVWMRNEAVDAGAGDAMFYRNIVVEENFIRNGHVHGISVGQAHGVSVQNNTLVLGIPDSVGGGGWPLVSVNAAATEVTIANNLGQKLGALKAQDGWTIANNLDLQAIYPARPGYMPEIFVNPHAGAAAEPADYRILPDSSAALAGQGASWMLYDGAPAALLAAAQFDDSPACNQVCVDGSLSTGPSGDAAAAGARFLWDFGDGTSAEGVRQSHVYASPGTYQITLTVELPDGQKDTASLSTTIAGPDVLTYDGHSGTMFSHLQGQDTALAAALPLVDLGDGSQAIQFSGGTADPVTLPKSALRALWGAEGFHLSTSLRMGSDGDAGTLAQIDSSFQVNVTKTGEAVLRLTPDGGSEIVVTTKGARLTDGHWHDLDITWDGDSGALTLAVDGRILGETTLVGQLQEERSWGLSLGNPWGKSFLGQIRAFELDAEPQNYVAAPDPGPAPALAPEASPAPVPAPQRILFDPGILGDDLKIFRDADAGDAPILLAPGTAAVQFGRVAAHEDSQQIAISTTFGRLADGGGTGQLIWNPGRFCLSLSKDALLVQVATAEAGDGMARFRTGDLGLDKAGMHAVVVLVDAEADVLKLYLDDVLVLDARGVDLELADIGREYGWDVGNRWKGVPSGDFAVAVTDFALADFSAVDPAVEALLIA